jgi:hypothetical protein
MQFSPMSIPRRSCASRDSRTPGQRCTHMTARQSTPPGQCPTCRQRFSAAAMPLTVSAETSVERRAQRLAPSPLFSRAQNPMKPIVVLVTTVACAISCATSLFAYSSMGPALLCTCKPALLRQERARYTRATPTKPFLTALHSSCEYCTLYLVPMPCRFGI